MKSASQLDRAPLGWAVLAGLEGLVLAFVPLFDVLGYELALALSPLAALCGAHLGMRTVLRARAAWPATERELAEVRPLGALLRLFGRAARQALLVLLVPLAISALNALRVRSCNPWLGLGWYLLLPVASALYAAALGVALGLVLGRGRALFAAVAVPLVALGWCLARLYFAPPIFVFDPLFGYFAGSLYDEHVAIPRALLYARAYHAALGAAFLASAALFLDGARLAPRWAAAAGRWRMAFCATLFVALALCGYRLGPRLGYRHDAATIAAALGGERRTAHFVVHYEPGGPYARELDDVAHELEFRYHDLSTALGVAPTREVHAFLFSSAAEKQALMGAGHTYIAKPWRREIYINHEAFPQDVLGHELAHVFGAEAGDRLLGLPRRGIDLNVGLTEGFAEALAWRAGGLTADEVVHVLDVLGRRPALSAVMSGRFWSLPSQQAYAVAGSFCRYLLRRGGANRLLALYARGGEPAAYPALYGADLSRLEADWLTEVRATPLEPGVLERERARLLRPSIFRRPCAHEQARLAELGRAASARGDHQAARGFYEALCADEPDDPAPLDELAAEALRAGDPAKAEATLARLLRHPKASAGQRAQAQAALGDVSARAGDFAAAHARYTRAEAEPSDDASARLYTVKRTLAARADAEPAARAALSVLTTLHPDPAADALRLLEAARAAPEDALLGYLAARQLFARGLYDDAEAKLDPRRDGALPDERFAREAARLRAEAAFRRHDYPEAQRRFDALATRGPAGARVDAARWAERARFFAEVRP